MIDALGIRHGGSALYPTQGPPWLPFQRWAMRAEPVYRSPLGVSIHPDYGLWHAYRGALAFRRRFVLPPRDPRPSPCESCVGKPCLQTCPVSAIRPDQYLVGTCAEHVGSSAGAGCLRFGCMARRACPVGVEFRYHPEQAHFHMTAFMRRR